MLELAQSGRITPFDSQDDASWQRQFQEHSRPKDKHKHKHKHKHKRAESPAPYDAPKATEPLVIPAPQLTVNMNLAAPVPRSRSNFFLNFLVSVVIVAVGVWYIERQKEDTHTPSELRVLFKTSHVHNDSSDPILFPCLLQGTDGTVNAGICFHNDRKPEKVELHHTMSRCARGHRWDANEMNCFACPMNTEVVVDPKTGFSHCKDCLAGSHNPYPAISHQCVCKPHLEPDGTGACLPCQPGWFKSDFHSHDKKCVECSTHYTGQDGGKSIDDCKAAPLGVSVPVPPKPKEELQNSVSVIFGGIVAKIKEILKKWFDKVFEFFNDMLKEGYKTFREMFKGWFQKDRIQQHPLSPLTVTKCRFFWWGCEEIPDIPQDPNKCPYQDWQQLFDHFKRQTQWINWRAEKDLVKRASLGRHVVVYFHPDRRLIPQQAFSL